MLAKIVDILIDTFPYFMPGFNHRFDCHDSRVGDIKFFWVKGRFGQVRISDFFCFNTLDSGYSLGGYINTGAQAMPYAIEVTWSPGVESREYINMSDKYGSILRELNSGPVVKFGGDA